MNTLRKSIVIGLTVLGMGSATLAAHAVEAEVRLYDTLFTVPKPDEAPDFKSVINPGSLETVRGAKVEAALKGDVAAAYAQFGPLSAYPRAQRLRELYPQLPDAPLPAVITCIASTREARGGGHARRTRRPNDRQPSAPRMTRSSRVAST